MKSHTGFILLSTAILLLWTPMSARGASNRTYYDDFTTSAYKDTLHTSAWWDTTGSGAIKLHTFELTLASSFDTPGNVFAVAVQGEHAYLADGSNGLVVLDITDPTNPSQVGYYNTSGTALGVAVEGDHLYIADGSNGLQVFSIADPATPVHVGHLDTPGSSYQVSIHGDNAYVADWSSGLRVIDISDPSSPFEVGFYDTDGYARCVAVDGDYAYVADHLSGLAVIDIADPSSLSLAATYATAGLAYSVVVDGDRALVAIWSYGLEVVDISDPTSPSQIATEDTPGTALGLAVDGQYVYIADGAEGFQAIDIDNPSDPVLLYGYDTSGSSYGTVLAGDYAYVADHSGGLKVIDVRDRMELSPIGYCYTPGGDPSDIVVAGDRAYLADLDSGLTVADISDPANPTIVGGYRTIDRVQELDVAGNYAYLAAQSAGLVVVDITDPADPSFAGKFVPYGSAFDVAVAGDYAYLATGSSGFFSLDITDPAHPSVVGRYDTNMTFDNLDVSGDYAYLLGYGYELTVLDISDPADPLYVASHAFGEIPNDLLVEGDYLYAATSDSFFVFDITDPTDPAIIGRDGSLVTPTGIAVDGDYAYVTDFHNGYRGLAVFDVSDPAHPLLLDNSETHAAHHLAIAGDYVYLVSYGYDLNVSMRTCRTYFTEENVAQSLAINDAYRSFKGLIVGADTYGTVRFEFSNDGGSTWEAVTPGSGGHVFDEDEYGDLLWRSTLIYDGLVSQPMLYDMDVEWLYSYPDIDSIVDVPGDQGGWVRLFFTRSGYDHEAEDEDPIAAYSIQRYFDDPALVETILNDGMRVDAGTLDCVGLTRDEPLVKTGAPDRESRTKSAAAVKTKDDTPHEAARFIPTTAQPGTTLYTLGGRYYLLPDGSGEDLRTSGWEVVQTVFARQINRYICLAPTQADGEPITFRIYAHSVVPTHSWVSYTEEGISYDNIPPGVPEGFAVEYNTGSGNKLSWEECQDDDFQYFRIYRGLSEDFEPALENLAYMTADIKWNDIIEEGWRYYYKITSLDHAGNESDPASPGTVTGTGDPTVPEAFVLHQNIPNPFNPATSIRFDLPDRAFVRLSIYDVSGRLVRVLAECSMEPGRKEIAWDGRDGGGRAVASGVYFYRLEAGTFGETKKMVLLR